MLVTSVAAFALLYTTDLSAWLYHALHKEELEEHWARRLYDESFRLLLKRSRQPRLEWHNFLSKPSEREALSRSEIRVKKIEPRHIFFTWRYSIAHDGSVRHTFKLWKCDYKIDIEYDLKVGSRDVGRMRARGILGLEDIHLLGAEVSSSEISPILLTKREKPLSFDLGIVLFPPRLWLPDKWRHQQST